jgi:DNA primase
MTGYLDVPKVLANLGVEVVYTSGNRIAAKCPLAEHEHDDTRPGFSVLPDSGRWVCFKGCGGPAPLEPLVARLLGIGPDQASQWLVRQGADLSLDGLMGSLAPLEPTSGGDKEAKRKLIEWDYGNQETTKTSRWLFDRGFTVGSIRRWGLRYDPNIPAIVIPIFNAGGTKLVGLQRREVVPGALPSKYFTSPGYDRDSHLFGAWMHPRDTGIVVLVEGPLDAIWLHQNGVVSVVALLGTFCSRKQARIIAELGGTVYLSLDNDEAGRKGGARIRRQLQGMLEVRSIALPSDANDVQDLSRDRVRRVFSGVVAG